jgi:crotonobetainyl-CoA:carnitine CoA-transferase CaiB-like acyl-CoA transferase
MEGHLPLAGYRVITLALNLPGPLAAHRFAELGARVVKIEPTTGDPLQFGAPEVYARLHQGIEVVQVDLKQPAGQDRLSEHLLEADLLLTSSRLAALDRLGLGWEVLEERYPSLVMVAIIGHMPPAENHPGHDLTYQAQHGLIDPPQLPASLFADLGGSLEAVLAGMGLLLMRARGLASGGERRVLVSLERSAEYFSQPRRWGLTLSNGFLGGGLPQYNLYRCETGWVALAALEPHFWARLQSSLGVENPTQADLRDVFARQSASAWEAWAGEHDVPLVAVRDESTMKLAID